MIRVNLFIKQKEIHRHIKLMASKRETQKVGRGKNQEVGLICVRACSVVPDSFQTHGLQSARLLCPWVFPGKNTRVGCHFLFLGIFLTLGLNQGLLHCRQSLALQGDSLPTEPSRQCKYTYTYLALSDSLGTLIHCTRVFIKIVCTW